jgi:hypothetical protein
LIVKRSPCVTKLEDEEFWIGFESPLDRMR